MTLTCPDCGSVQIVPMLPPRATAACHRCDRLLERRSTTRLQASLACSVAVVVLLIPATFMPLMHSTIGGILFEESRLATSVPVIYREVWFPFAFGFLFFAVIFPGMRALLMVVVLGSIRLRHDLAGRGRMFRIAEELRIWCMTDVVVLAGVITYFRAAAPARVELEIGAYCYLAVAALASVADRWLDQRAVWNEIYHDTSEVGERVVSCGVCELAVTSRRGGDPCPRCGATLDRDLHRLLGPATGALVAAVILIFPAFNYVIMVNQQIIELWEHTVMGTVRLLAEQGLWYLGVAILFAGVVIPVTQIVGLTWLLLSVHFPMRRTLIVRTRFYRVLRGVVRWPMLIPFIIALAAPIVAFRRVDNIIAGPGATPYFLLIVMIMLAVRFFEPRLMWQSAGVVR